MLRATSKRSWIGLYLFFGLAFLLWENLIGSIIGIYALEFRRTIWGILYYGLLFLIFGGFAEGFNFLYDRLFSGYRWFGQKYVWLLVILVLVLWGDISRQFLMKVCGIESVHLSYLVNLIWLPFACLVGLLGNIIFAKLDRTNKLPDSRRLLIYFCAAVLFLIISTKVSYRYFHHETFSPPNLLLQPLFVFGVLLLAGIAGKLFTSNLSFRAALIWVPFILTFIIVGLSAGINSMSGNSPNPVQPPSEHPNIIVMLFDALRADHVGAISPEYSLTPNIDSLAQQGKVYRSCYSTSSWTFPAVVSLLTSHLPNKLGLVNAGMLPENVPNLASKLRRNGYRTACFSTNPFLSPTYGFDRFFDEFYVYLISGKKQLFLPYSTFFPYPWFLDELAYQFDFISTDYIAADCREMNRRAANFLYKSRSEPYFLYMHFLEPHQPYYSMPFEDKILNFEKLKLFYDLFMSTLGDQYENIFPEKIRGFLLETQHERYINGVRTADLAVAKMMQDLERLGLSENTVVIIIADHGEEFMEHGLMGHKSSVFEEQVRIPLIFFVPPELRIDLKDQPAGVSMVDIAPTILDIAGVEPEILHGDGRSLLRAWPEDDRPRYVMMERKGRFLAGVVTGSYKLIIKDNTRSGRIDTMLFNLSIDPGEKVNLYPKEKHITDSLAVYLQYQLDQSISSPLKAPAKLSPEEIHWLRSLGYLN